MSFYEKEKLRQKNKRLRKRALRLGKKLAEAPKVFDDVSPRRFGAASGHFVSEEKYYEQRIQCPVHGEANAICFDSGLDKPLNQRRVKMCMSCYVERLQETAPMAGIYTEVPEVEKED